MARNFKEPVFIRLHDLLQKTQNLIDLWPNAKGLEVVHRRHGLNGLPQHTLQKIGTDFGLTRERIRQIENNTINQLKSSDEFKKLENQWSEVLTEIFTDYQGVLGQNFLVDLCFTEKEATLNRPTLIFILNKLLVDVINSSLKSKQHYDLWYFEKDQYLRFVDKLENLISLFNTTETVFKTSDLHKTTQEAEVDLNISENELMNLLNTSRQIDADPFGRWGKIEWKTVNPINVRDKIYLILKESSKPLHFTEIATKIDELGFDTRKTNAPTVHNELILDKRYVLVGRGMYALTDWGYKPGVVSDVINDVLANNPQGIPRESLVDQVLKRRHVKKATVLLAIKNTPHFYKKGLYFKV